MLENKRLLLITSEFPPLPGGIGNHAFFLAKYVQKEGYDVSVISDFRDEKQDSEFDKRQSFKVFRTKRNLFTQLSRIKKSFSLTKQNQIIVCSGRFSLWLGFFLSMFFHNKKFIAVLHGSELKAGGKFSCFLTKRSLSSFDKLIAVSEFTKQYALCVNKKIEIEVINNGIEINNKIENIQRTEKSEKINLVTVGNLTFRKGQQNVIKALPVLKEKFPEVHYHCIGMPTEKKSFEKLAEELHVIANITFHGVLSEEEKNAVLSDCDVFCMLSSVLKNGDVEGFGIAILEANAIGIPAIGSNDSGIVDAIKNYANGVLVNPENIDEIVDALKLILEDYDNYSFRAKERSKMFQWSNIIQSYVNVLNS